VLCSSRTASATGELYTANGSVSARAFPENPVRRLQRFKLILSATLRSRCGHYIFALWFLSFFFSSPNLSGRGLDVYHTSTHDVALVRI